MFIPTHFTNFDCVICLESIECFKTPTECIVYPKKPKHEQNVFISACKHVYHQDCIRKWLKKGSNQCPQCRHQIITRNTFKYVDNNDTDSESIHNDFESIHDDTDFVFELIEFLKYETIANYVSKYIFHDNATILLFICNILQNTLHSSISCFSTISKYMKEKVDSIIVFYVIVSMH